jgi:hypothetical protein
MKFGRMLVLSKATPPTQASIRNHILYVKCRCDCGKEKCVRMSSLKRGDIVSCGCYHKEVVTRHGMTIGGRHPLYTVYDSMITRCYCKDHPTYTRHGARGIKVCKAWLNDKQSFFDWALDKWKPGLWIERIDNNGHYTPKNCTFNTPRDNTNNRECSRTYFYQGKNRSAFEIAELYGINGTKLNHRLVRGMTLKEALRVCI